MSKQWELNGKKVKYKVNVPITKYRPDDWKMNNIWIKTVREKMINIKKFNIHNFVSK